MKKEILKKDSSQKSARRVGRGGKRGKTSGKGMKGQKSRAGNSTRPEMRDIIKKLPKRRGHGKNRAKTVVPHRELQVVNLDQLSKHFASGSEVTPRALLSLGLVRRESGKLPKVKVLARGEMTTKLTLSGMVVSEGARAAIEKAGGTIV